MDECTYTVVIYKDAQCSVFFPFSFTSCVCVCDSFFLEMSLQYCTVHGFLGLERFQRRDIIRNVHKCKDCKRAESKRGKTLVPFQVVWLRFMERLRRGRAHNNMTLKVKSWKTQGKEACKQMMIERPELIGSDVLKLEILWTGDDHKLRLFTNEEFHRTPGSGV